MARLQQTSVEQYYMGWYGTCPDEAGTESECASFPLVTGQFTTLAHAVFPDPEGDSIGLNKPQSTFFKEIREVDEFSGAWKSYIGSTSTWTGMMNFGVTELQCGRTYWIILKPGSDFLDIPEFQFANQATSSYEYRIADECDSDPGPGPTACTALATLKDNNTIAEITIDWSTITNTNQTNGTIQALEVVFDNIVFESQATTSGASGKPMVTADWGNQSNSEINNFKNTTGSFIDWSIRDNGSLPTQQNTVFGMMSFTAGLTLETYQSGDPWVFRVPVHSVSSGSEPVISEIRVYDSSNAVLKYNVVDC